ncbi:MAG: S8 family serine peptidase [Acidobacteria bacterium]|nr:S8 family serine peptidase [Acidobacteriota bacterium]
MTQFLSWPDAAPTARAASSRRRRHRPAAHRAAPLLAAALTVLAAVTAAAGGGAQAQAPPGPGPGPAPRLQASARAQIQALMSEKAARTPAQRKLDSHLIYALLRQRQDPRLASLAALRVPGPAADGTMLVDVKAFSPNGVKPILARLKSLGARISSVQLRYGAIRARLLLAATETVAAMPEVRFVQPASRPIFEHFDSEGDATHRAAQARTFFGVDGTGVKICVLSSGVDSLADLQAAGELPAVDVLAGQAGSGDEGTAMLEIVHDLAPGAALGFATAQPDEATFAANVMALRSTESCDVLVDDVAYLSESPFQDNLIADAVNQVTAAGALYFSSAGNEGNLDAGTSGTWEGDFKPNGNLDPVLGPGAGTTNDFGNGGQSDMITADTQDGIVLHWSDPAAASCNDYDLYVLDNSLSTVLEASTNTQSCTQDPIEEVGNALAGEQVVVVQFSGANRLLNVLAFRGQLQLATAGCTRGHSSAAAAFGIAAAPAAAGLGPPAPNGPFPHPYDATQLLEPFTCDGPRRIFYDVNGNLLPGAPAGDFSSTGGVVRQKPDLTAADGVSTDVNNFRPFFGTSASAPHAAAIAGLLRSALPALPAAQVRSALTGSAIDVLAPGWDRDSGFGIVMAYQALQAAGAQPHAALALGTVTPTEVTPGGDTAIDPGEDWQLSIALNDTGGAAATMLSATLSSSTPGVGITNATSPYPDLAAGGGSGANSLPFLFTPYNVPCGQPIQFTLTVTFAGGISPAVFHFILPTGHAGAPAATSYTGPAVPIPDGGNPPGALNEFPGTPAIVPLAVAGVPGRVEKLTFSLDGTACTTAAGATTVGVDHTFVNDLTFDLQSPAGTMVRVISRADLEGHNFCQVVLDDDTANPSIQTVTSSQAPFTGTWQPNVALAAFKGQDPNGTWNLTAIDHFGQDTGNVRAFSLVIIPAMCAAAVPLTASLTATKAVTGGNLLPGGTVVYTVTLTNSGTGATFDEAGDELTDTLPATLTPTSATASLGTVSITGNTVHWNGGVPAGGSVVITINAAISSAAAVGSVISNQGTVNYDATRSGTNQTSIVTNDPSRPGPTQFVVGGATANIPALSGAGMAAMALALLLSGAVMIERRRRQAGRARGH